MSLRACVALAFASLNLVLADDVEFQDTPLLSSLWEAANNKDNDAIDRLLDSSAHAVSARVSDGRGLAWWGFEFKNAYVLGAIIAYGGDVESEDEDLQGQSAKSMCEEDSECDLAALIAESKTLSEDIKKKEGRAW